jgi:hypothetical protein
MKNFISTLGALLVLFFLVTVSSVTNAASIDVFNLSTQGAQINNWVFNIGNSASLVEDFESLTPGWSSSLETNVGTFTNAGASPGTGSTAYKDSNEPKFQLRDFDANGRRDITENGVKTNYLDSADITQITLNVKPNTFTNLFFYITDPGDVGALTSIASGGLFAFIDPNQLNGTGFFVGIDFGDEYISEIIWNVSNTNDGFGLDNFSTVNATPVPEPTSILLFGSGLVGISSFLRKRKK